MIPIRLNYCYYICEIYAEKCATFGANSKFLCFKTVLDEVVVKVGLPTTANNHLGKLCTEIG